MDQTNWKYIVYSQWLYSSKGSLLDWKLYNKSERETERHVKSFVLNTVMDELICELNNRERGQSKKWKRIILPQ